MLYQSTPISSKKEIAHILNREGEYVSAVSTTWKKMVTSFFPTTANPERMTNRQYYFNQGG
jgi:hypothetical protein|tara:strand:- start:993 stop:1175 length:183 start_codon:yes stop_codon:yes gene_type:complete